MFLFKFTFKRIYFFSIDLRPPSYAVQKADPFSKELSVENSQSQAIALEV